MRIDWRRALVVELALLAGCALAVVAWLVLARVLHTVLLLLMAAVVAFAVGPMVARVEARLGRRGPAVVVVYLGLAIAVLGGLALLSSPFVRQAAGLLDDLPRLADAAHERAPAIDARLRQLGLPVSVQDMQTRAAALLVDSGSAFLGGSLAALAGLANVLVDLLLVLVMSLYLVLDGVRLRAAFLRLLPAGRRAQALFVEDTVVRVAGGYLRGQLVMALSIGVLAGLGAMLFGLRYPIVVGVVAGLLELVPMFGPVLGAVPALLLALVFQPFPTVLWVGLYFLAIQQVESNLLGPRITGHAVGLHPLAALLALLAGLEMAGVLGGLFAVPAVGVAWVLVGALYRRLGQGAAEPPVRRGWRIDAWRAPRVASRTTSVASESVPASDPLA
jgi:predicted PurR-regulated permease PerM